ncbi:hypothetical protein IE981_14660 [Klebsiella pneumoniae]|nr:hypothetical protein [Klebsiella pneumoniae]
MQSQAACGVGLQAAPGLGMGHEGHGVLLMVVESTTSLREWRLPVVCGKSIDAGMACVREDDARRTGGSTRRIPRHSRQDPRLLAWR